MTISWTAGAASDGAIVVVRAGNAVADGPTDGTLHTASATFGSGANLGNASYVVYRGSGTSVDVTGLTAGATYHVAVYAYKGTVADSNDDQGINYRQTSPATGSAPTCPPAPVIAAATGVGSTNFTANWQAASGATGYRLDVMTDVGGGGSGTIRTNDCADVGGGTTTSYLTRIWTNNTDVVWTAYKARTDQTVNGNPSVCLRNESGAYIETTSLPAGLGSLSFDVQQMFTGSGGTLTVYVNGTQVGSPFAYGTTAGTATFSDIDVQNVTSLIISNNTTARPAINNIVWSDYGAGSPTYVPGYEARVLGDVTSCLVTGLASQVKYYYRVRAVNASCESENSETTNVTTVVSLPSVALSDNGTQVGAASVAAGTAGHILHRFTLAVTLQSATLTGVSFTSAGTYGASDLSNFKVWYSADATLETGSDTLLGTISTDLGTGLHSLSGLSQVIAKDATGYVFITADIASGAAAGKTISVNALTTADVTFASANKSGSTVAGGAQTFTAAVTIDNTGTPAAGNVAAGASDVPVFGFRLSPTYGSVDFTAVKVTVGGTATSSDLSGFEVVYDANNNGVY